MDLAEFLSIIWRSKWIILVTVVVTTSYVAFKSIRESPTYSANATLTVVGTAVGPLGSSSGLDKTAAVYGDLLQIDEVLQSSIDKARINVDPAVLKGQVDTSIEKEKPYLTISVVDKNPGMAVEEANAVSNGLVSYVNDMNKNNQADSSKLLTEQLTQVENSMNKVRNVPDQLDQLFALNDVKDSIVKQMQQVNVDTILTRLNVLSLAKDSTPLPTQKTRNIILSFFVSLVVGVTLGFVYNSAKDALRLHE